MGLYDKIANARQGLYNSEHGISADDPQGIYRNNGKLKSVKASKLQLASDYSTLQNDPGALGLTDSQKEAMKAEAAQTAGAQAQAQSTGLAQSALAGQGFQQGAFEAGQQGAADSAANAGVQASTAINDLSTKMIQQEKSRILAEMDAARERTRQDARQWAQFGVDSAGKAVSSVTSALDTAAGMGPA